LVTAASDPEKLKSAPKRAAPAPLPLVSLKSAESVAARSSRETLSSDAPATHGPALHLEPVVPAAAASPQQHLPSPPPSSPSNVSTAATISINTNTGNATATTAEEETAPQRRRHSSSA
jgi:hypothetical protein